MDEQSPKIDGSTIARAKRFDALCDEFETQCSAGNRPSIESFLLRVDGSDKQPLLVELISIEMHYRRQNGESIAFAEYQARFPGLSALRLEATIQHSEQRNSPKTPAADDATIDSQQVSSQRQESKLVKYFGDYELLDVIARGGMGIVYKARQVSLNRIVALKMILSGEFASKQEVDRFYLEAKAAALLDHPGIVPIYEVGEHEGKHFFSMTYVEGSSLAAKLNEGPLAPLQAANTMLEVSRAVHYAHEQGVIHRDLKPSNILLDLQGRPRVTDFGLAKRLSEDTGMTVSGQVLGTPSYMPPEQAAGHINTIGPCSDVYALGAVLYSLTTGRPPFQSASSIDTLRQVVEKEPVAPRQLNSAIPRDLETIILKCLEKSLPRRYGSAKLLCEELQRFIEGRPIHARPISRTAKAWRWCRRQPIVASLVTSVFLLLCAFALSSSLAYLRELSLGKALKVSFEKERQAKDKAIEATEVAKKATQSALEAAEQAESARTEKERQAEIAEREKEKAKASEANTRRNLYVTDAARVEELVKQSNLGRAKVLLERHIPKSSDDEDLRGFDWYYHWSQVKQEKAKYEFKKPVEVIDLSQDERTLVVGCEGGRAYLLNVETGKVSDAIFTIRDDHWSTISFVGGNRVWGQGRQGAFKLWDITNGTTLASKPAWNDGKLHNGGPIVDRVPARVSKNGNRIIGCDNENNLALWTLDPLRPRPLPFINEGIHPTKYGDYLTSAHFYMVPKFSSNMNFLLDNQLLLDSGFANWHDLMLKKRIDELPMHYATLGGATSIPNTGVQESPIGHPVNTLCFSRNGKYLLSGTVAGEIQLWGVEKLEAREKWPAAAPRKKWLSREPILDITVSPDCRFAIACNEHQCHVLRLPTLDVVNVIDSEGNPFTKVHMIDDERLAIGRSNGVVDVWNVTDSKRVARFLSGGGNVTGIAMNDRNSHLFVSNSDGSITKFEMKPEKVSLVPSTTSRMYGGESMRFLPSSKRIAFHKGFNGELVLADPRAPLNATKLNLTGPGMMQLVSQDPRIPVLFCERPKKGELLTIHSREVYLWDSKTWELVKNIDYSVHTDELGIEHSLKSNKHKRIRFECREDSISQVMTEGNDNSKTTRDYQPFAQQIITADLFRDESRLLLVVDSINDNGRELTLFLRDIESGAIIYEVIIAGVRCKVGESTAKCLDDSRVLIDSVIVGGKPSDTTQGLVWNVNDNSMRLITTSTAKDRPQPVGGPSDTGPIQARNRRQVAIWDPSMVRILDSESLTVLTSARAPKPFRIHLAHLNEMGELFAVLSIANSFRWAHWDRHSSEWRTVFEGVEDGSFLSQMRWCLDAQQSMLFKLRDSSVVARWDIVSGRELSPLRMSSGSIERVRVNETGVTVALTESKVSQLQSPWNVTWFHDDVQIESTEVPIKSHKTRAIPYFFPLSHSGVWLTSDGTYLGDRKSRAMPIRFVGKDLQTMLPNSEVLLSEDKSCLVQCVDRTIHSWSLKKEGFDDSLFVYEFDASHSIAPHVLTGSSLAAPDGAKFPLPTNSALQEDVPLHSISPDGTKVAARVGKEVFWSARPFQDWSSVPMQVAGLASVTSLKWSWDNSTVAIGLSSGDILIHNMRSNQPRMFARGHRGTVYDVLWLPDRRTLASAGEEGAIIIWDLVQGEIRNRINAHNGAAKSLAFESRTNTLVSGGADGQILRWLAPLEERAPAVSDFAPPDPDSEIVEIAAAPSQADLRNRELARWLVEKKAINHTFTSFGLPVGENAKAESIDGLAVNTVSFNSNGELNDDDLDRFAGLTELRGLYLANCNLTSVGLSRLKGLDSLQELNLSGIDLTGFDMNSLGSSSNLHALWLRGCHVSDDQFLAITKLFPQLRVLEISDAPLSDLAVSKIDSLKNLKALSLSNTNVSIHSLSAIQSLRQLEQLDLSNTQIQSENLTQLGSLKLLKRLRVRGVRSLDGWLEQLDDWKHLKLLDIRDCDVGVESVTAFMKRRGNVDVYLSPEVFGKHAELEILLKLGPLRGSIEVDGKLHKAVMATEALRGGGSITGLNWPMDKERTIDDLALLAKLPKLERISLSTDAVPRIHLPILLKMENLRKLEIIQSNLTDEETKSVGDLQQIRSLKVKYLSGEFMVEQVKKLRNLESLEYESGVGIDDLMPSLPNLRNLVCPAMKATELSKAAPFLVSLESLTLPGLPDKDVVAIIAKLKNLKQLRMRTGISAASLKKLQDEMPGIVVTKFDK